jgi:hypothetical protein
MNMLRSDDSLLKRIAAPIEMFAAEVCANYALTRRSSAM